MEWFNKNLTDIQLVVLKLMKLRGKSAPICDGTIFIGNFTTRYTNVLELVKRGLMYQTSPTNETLMFNITSDGLRLANKIK